MQRPRRGAIAGALAVVGVCVVAQLAGDSSSSALSVHGATQSASAQRTAALARISRTAPRPGGSSSRPSSTSASASVTPTAASTTAAASATVKAGSSALPQAPPAPHSTAKTTAPTAPAGGGTVTTKSSLRTGVYAAAGSGGITAAAAFDRATGVTSSEVLDFAGTDSWASIDGPGWLLDPHSGQSARFEYSLPMFPETGGYSLQGCSSGAYNSNWTTLAQNLVASHLANTIVRPGWEFNGTWYYWNAATDPNAYIGCFRQIVTTMRAVAGQQFLFDWNPNIGPMTLPGEKAYPGDAYVDFVGLDVYDYSPTNYFGNSASAAGYAAAWDFLYNGDHGLAFWVNFTRSHGKRMAITEWGVSDWADGHGGGDNPSFINNLLNFMVTNGIAYEHYFDCDNSSDQHKVDSSWRFPNSLAALKQDLHSITGT